MEECSQFHSNRIQGRNRLAYISEVDQDRGTVFTHDHVSAVEVSMLRAYSILAVSRFEVLPVTSADLPDNLHHFAFRDQSPADFPNGIRFL